MDKRMFSGSRTSPTSGASGSVASAKNNDDLPLSATLMIVNSTVPGKHPQVIEHETVDANSRHVAVEIVNDGRNAHSSQKASPRMPFLSEWVQSAASKLDELCTKPSRTLPPYLSEPPGRLVDPLHHSVTSVSESRDLIENSHMVNATVKVAPSMMLEG
ncbi:hypothetical protein V6N13_061246 [Hibiscus sabdariffa]